MNQPKVSVCLVTYNQENYITDCLQSIVTQKTNFPFEIIIGNDASTDNTTAIIEQYVQQYPHLIKHIKREKNVGGSVNYIDVHNQANGEYVCHIDGDDMMLPNKLQIQADFLDANPQYSLVASKCILFNDEGKEWKEWVYNTDRTDGLEIKINNELILQIFNGNMFFYHSSIMYRKNLKTIRSQLLNPFNDYIFVLDILKNSKGFILNNILSKYRFLSKNSFTINTNKNIKIKLFYNNFTYFIDNFSFYKKNISTVCIYSIFANIKNYKLLNYQNLIYLKLWLKSGLFFSINEIKKLYYYRQNILNIMHKNRTNL